MRRHRLHRFKKLITQIIILLALFFIPENLFAHGVDYEVKEGKAVVIRAGYDDGEPMSYAEIKIFSPDNKDIEHQNGRTDKNGCFAFLPDQIGEWRVVVNDGMGHGVVTEVEVFAVGESASGGKEAMKIETTAKGWPRWQKLITGVSIIWGLAGLVFYLKAKKRIA